MAAAATTAAAVAQRSARNAAGVATPTAFASANGRLKDFPHISSVKLILR